jgi:mannose/fructose/N-acetylgalactosamine-specific phosphotransferase system component IIC
MNWPGIFAIGGIVGVDSSSCMQSMLSRPLVAGAMTGALLGNPLGGTLLGAVMEAFQLAILPVGAARYPETGTATVAGTAAYTSSAAVAFDPPALLLALLFGLAWGRVTGLSVVWGRRANERIVERVLASERPSKELGRWQAIAIALDFLRAGSVSLIGAAVGTLLLARLLPLWALPAILVFVALSAAVAALLAGTLDLFGGWRDRKLLFLIGVLCGSLVVAFT